jgi:hypothetical protein
LWCRKELPIFLSVCEYATVNPDGTFTVIRGGINTVSAPALPVHLSGALYLEISPGEFPPGEYAFTIKMRDPMGADVLDFAGRIDIQSQPRPARLAIGFSTNFQTTGEVMVVCRVGESEQSYVVEVKLDEKAMQ